MNAPVANVAEVSTARESVEISAWRGGRVR